MADDHTQRPYRSNEPQPRNAPSATPGPSSDPLAELARLIGQNDPFAEFGRDGGRRAPPQPAPEWSVPPATPPAAQNFGGNDYYAASTAPAASQPVSETPHYGAPARQAYDSPPYTAGADLYHTESERPGYAAATAGGYMADPYQQSQMHQAGEEEDIYDDIPPPRRRMGIMAIAAVFALAVIGTAGAFGYRALFGSSGASGPPPVIKADTAPSKIVPATASNKLITDRVPDHAQDEKLVSREEKPVEVKSDPPAAAMLQTQDGAPSAANQAALGSGVIAGEPKKIRTIAIHPDQPGMGEGQPVAAIAAAPPPVQRAAAPSGNKPAAPQPRVAASSPPLADNPNPPPAPRQTEARATPPERHAAAAPARNAPLSLSPDANTAPQAAAPRAPMRTAAAAAPAPVARAAAPAGGSGSYVQVSSQRSEADAQAAFRGLQAKYPSQLGNRQPVIRKVDLGAKGTYYRTMVGPLAGNEANELCSGLKAAGGACLIQRN